MAAPTRPAPPSARLCLASIALLSAGISGCGNETARQAIEREVKQNPKYQLQNVSRFAGRVTIDGQPPAKDLRLFVILNDPQHLDENARLRAPKMSAICDDGGKFAFGTYDKDDGVPAAEYVLTFALLHAPTASAGHGARMRQGTGARHFKGPDELKNLYNDPDKNQKVDEFNIKLAAPGKADYKFDLALAGKEAAEAGPHAVTTIISPR
jgi:hypothetical protein